MPEFLMFWMFLQDRRREPSNNKESKKEDDTEGI